MGITIGLYYNGARYLAAWLGRWTSADPIGMQAGVNLYQYCRGSPTNYTDPTGTHDRYENAPMTGSIDQDMQIRQQQAEMMGGAIKSKANDVTELAADFLASVPARSDPGDKGAHVRRDQEMQRQAGAQLEKNLHLDVTPEEELLGFILFDAPALIAGGAGLLKGGWNLIETGVKVARKEGPAIVEAIGKGAGKADGLLGDLVAAGKKLVPKVNLGDELALVGGGKLPDVPSPAAGQGPGVLGKLWQSLTKGSGEAASTTHRVDPYDVFFSQKDYGPSFTNPASPWGGKTVAEAADRIRSEGKLPPGLTLNVVDVNGRFVALNNRTLAAARLSNTPEVTVVNVGPSGWNALYAKLRESGLIAPIENAIMRGQ